MNDVRAVNFDYDSNRNSTTRATTVAEIYGNADNLTNETTDQLTGVDPLVNATGQPFSYAGDDPVNDVDPSGANAFSDFFTKTIPSFFSSSCLEAVGSGIGGGAFGIGSGIFGAATAETGFGAAAGYVGAAFGAGDVAYSIRDLYHGACG